jgi:hypothetical protein
VRYYESGVAVGEVSNLTRGRARGQDPVANLRESFSDPQSSYETDGPCSLGSNEADPGGLHSRYSIDRIAQYVRLNPLPEHPRPDFQRAEWLNLNGTWRFAFDPRDEGERLGWAGAAPPFQREILVPFSWGAPLSGVPDSANIAWYARQITVPESWRGRRVFLVVGACDWRTTVWLDGARLGAHQGGYTPFVELSPRLRDGGASLAGAGHIPSN